MTALAAIRPMDLQRLLVCFASYYVNDRTHSSLEKDAPAMRAVESKPHPAAEVIP